MNKKRGKKGCALLLTAAMVLSSFAGTSLKPIKVKANQGTGSQTETLSPSYFQENVDDTFLANYDLEKNDNSAGKIRFGTGFTDNTKTNEWYVTGKEDGALVLLASDGSKKAAFHQDTTNGYNQKYSESDITPDKLMTMFTDNFTTPEKDLMKEVTVYTDEDKNRATYDTTIFDDEEVARGREKAVTGKLYIPNSHSTDMNDTDNYIFTGTKDDIPVFIARDTKVKVEGGNGFVWLRSPDVNNISHALVAALGNYVDYGTVDSEYVSVVPAFHLNLSSVIFSSAATAASSENLSTLAGAELTANTFTLRYKDDSDISVAYSSELIQTKNAKDKFLMVQTADHKIYAKQIASDDEIIKVTDVNETLTALTENDKVWVESTTDRITKATLGEWKSHIHLFTYEVNEAGNSLVVNCGARDCDIADSKVVYALNAPEASALTYDGTAKEVVASVSPSNANFEEITGLTAGEITYYTKYSAGASDNVKTTVDCGAAAEGKAPKNVGDYTAVVTISGTVRGEVKSYTLVKTFAIAKGEVADADKTSVVMKDYTYGESVTPDNSKKVDGANITYRYSVQNKTTDGTVWTDTTAQTLTPGTYYIYAEIAASTNYNAYTTGTVPFTVAEKTFADGDITVKGIEKNYDGKGTSISVTVNPLITGARVQYKKTGDTEYSDTNPVFTEVGEYTVSYRVTAPNYTAKEGSEIVKIKQDATPGTNPGTNPSTEPGTSPSTEPGTSPSTDPSTNPTVTPSDKPSNTPSEIPSDKPDNTPSVQPGKSDATPTPGNTTKPSATTKPSSGNSVSTDNKKPTTSVTTKVKKPKKVKSIWLTKKKHTKGKKRGSVVVKFKKLKGVSGYTIEYSKNNKFKKGVKKVNVKKTKTSGKIKNLKKGTYYIRVKAYVKKGSKKIYGAASKVVKLKIK